MSVSSDSFPSVHVLVSAAEIESPTALDTARDLIDIGPAIAVHLRARVSAALLFEVARDLAARAWVSGGWCVVSGRPDIALAASAQAVQLGRTALPVAAVRAFLPDDGGVRIGASVHGPAEAEVAVAAGAGYLVAGTTYPTPSHPGTVGVGAAGIGEVIGAARLADAGRRIPVLAIGGVDRTRLCELVGAGASGVVVGRAVWEAEDPIEAARDLVQGLEA